MVSAEGRAVHARSLRKPIGDLCVESDISFTKPFAVQIDAPWLMRFLRDLCCPRSESIKQLWRNDVCRSSVVLLLAFCHIMRLHGGRLTRWSSHRPYSSPPPDWCFVVSSTIGLTWTEDLRWFKFMIFDAFLICTLGSDGQKNIEF